MNKKSVKGEQQELPANKQTDCTYRYKSVNALTEIRPHKKVKRYSSEFTKDFSSDFSSEHKKRAVNRDFQHPNQPQIYRKVVKSLVPVLPKFVITSVC